MIDNIPEDFVFRHFLRSLKRNVAEQQRLSLGQLGHDETVEEEDPVLIRALAAAAERPPQGDTGTAIEGKQGTSGALDTADLDKGSPQLLQERPNGVLGLEDGHASDALAETVFKAYWQGWQHAGDNTHSTWKPQAVRSDTEQQDESLNDPKIASLLESWYKAGRTSGYLSKDRDNRAS